MYQFLKWIAWLLVRLTVNYTIVGRENIPAQGPLLVVSNHLSVGDPVLIGISLNRKVIFMAKEELFRDRFTSFFVRSFGAFPVYRGSSSRDALRQAVGVLKNGSVLGMFPEGKRSADGCLMQPLNGAALIAWHTRCPVLPVGITGSEDIRGYGWFWRRPKVTMVIGRPFCLPEMSPGLKRDTLSCLSGVMMRQIADLLPERRRGRYTEME